MAGRHSKLARDAPGAAPSIQRVYHRRNGTMASAQDTILCRRHVAHSVGGDVCSLHTPIWSVIRQPHQAAVWTRLGRPRGDAPGTRALALDGRCEGANHIHNGCEPDRADQYLSRNINILSWWSTFGSDCRTASGKHWVSRNEILERNVYPRARRNEHPCALKASGGPCSIGAAAQ
jgi:hypothetical protein